VSALLALLDAALTLAGGAALAGLVSTQLRPLERVLVAIVGGIIAGAAITYGLALVAGLNVATVLAGPAVLAALSAVVAYWAGDLRAPWRASWDQGWARWHERSPANARLAAVAAVSIGALAALIFAVIFAHTIYEGGGALQAGYPTVWADWSQHLSTQASFAVANNLPPVNPLLSGTPLLYPFLPDFHSATLVTLGLSPGAALAIPGAVLAFVCALLIVALAQRLGAGTAAGVIAAVICFIGGGLGFEAVFADACANHGISVSQCTLPYVVSHPGDALGIISGTLHELPGTIASQSRAYDGLPSDGGPPPFAGMAWYTPLLAWWLPQRTILYGFAAAVGVFILVSAALRTERRGWGAFAVSGVLLGLLPLVHVQTLIAAGVVLLILAIRHRRLEWITLLGAALLLAGPRLLQLAVGPHGSAAFGNAYPWLEPGWMGNAATAFAPAGRIDLSFAGFLTALGSAVVLLATGGWWGFWVSNLGVAVPLCFVVLIAAAARWLPGTIGAAGRRISGFFPGPVLEFFLAAMVIFALADFVIFQSWDWDNTKLLVYWYLAVALLIGTLATRWWRRWWRAAVTTAIVGTTVLTGLLVVSRMLPWTPQSHSMTGPYTIASAQERNLAETINATTPKNAVFLTFGRPNDPLLTIAGRTGVMGYYGWLWSYGVDFGSRYSDVREMYRGCAAATEGCAVRDLLKRYRISFVEIDDRSLDPGAIEPQADPGWWSSQGFKVVGRTDHITVYDVRAGG
jgi:hypothetical protein